MQQFIQENEKVYLNAFKFLNQHALSKVEQEAMENEIAEFAHSCYARLNSLSSGPEYRTTQSIEHVQAVLSFLADVSVDIICGQHFVIDVAAIEGRIETVWGAAATTRKTRTTHEQKTVSRSRIGKTNTQKEGKIFYRKNDD